MCSEWGDCLALWVRVREKTSLTRPPVCIMIHSSFMDVRKSNIPTKANCNETQVLARFALSLICQNLKPENYQKENRRHTWGTEENLKVTPWSWEAAETTYASWTAGSWELILHSEKNMVWGAPKCGKLNCVLKGERAASRSCLHTFNFHTFKFQRAKAILYSSLDEQMLRF